MAAIQWIPQLDQRSSLHKKVYRSKRTRGRTRFAKLGGVPRGGIYKTRRGDTRHSPLRPLGSNNLLKSRRPLMSRTPGCAAPLAALCGLFLYSVLILQRSESDSPLGVGPRGRPREPSRSPRPAAVRKCIGNKSIHQCKSVAVWVRSPHRGMVVARSSGCQVMYGSSYLSTRLGEVQLAIGLPDDARLPA